MGEAQSTRSDVGVRQVSVHCPDPLLNVRAKLFLKPDFRELSVSRGLGA
jgi:hypothetical protein